MSVFIFDHDALDKMALIEGERWKRLQLKGEMKEVSFVSFKKAWNEFATNKKSKTPDMGITNEYGNGAIYGHDGWTRYTVRANGEILFIKALSPSPEITQKAIDAGFNLF